MRFDRVFLSLLTLVGLFLSGEPAARADDSLDQFEREVRPILAKRCYGCHSGQVAEPKGGLRLDQRAAVLRGGDSGSALDPADPARSLLLAAVRREAWASPMPPDEPLPAEELQALVRWVEQGAAMPEEVSSVGNGASHWAFQPLARRDPPPSAERRPLDAWAAVRRRAAEVVPNEPAERRVLVRRLYFDLLGLPPSYEEAESFVRDPREDAYSRLVERLLGSPRFGERWARVWMDVSRYADTKGYVFQEDRSYPNAYRYRQWLIEAFNRDLPFDAFLKAQLAADLFPEFSEEDRWAMGYLTLGRMFLRNKHDIIDDRIDVVTRGMMGLTVTCARCHDHKYDPIPTRDYYALYGIFDSTKAPEDETALWLVDVEKPHDSPILLRGSPGNHGPVAPRRFLSALAGEESPRFDQGSGRRQLAEAIAHPDNPLTARVWVNRVWGQLFGRFLVDTPSDFGLRSDPPALPEVLDHLADAFLRSGWSHKELVREIVLSETYRQSSQSQAAAASADPENRLFWRQQRRRLQFEQLRDAMLAVSDCLDQAVIGGPSVDITAEEPAFRRSLYAHIDRQNLPGLFRTFDFASPDTHAPQRYNTTVPQQALYLMNSPFALQAAGRLAEAATRAGADAEAALVLLYRRILSRDPAPEEAALQLAFLKRQGWDGASAPEARQTALQLAALALLQSNEFAFVD